MLDRGGAMEVRVFRTVKLHKDGTQSNCLGISAAYSTDSVYKAKLPTWRR